MMPTRVGRADWNDTVSRKLSAERKPMMITRSSLRCVVDLTDVRRDRHPQPPQRRRVPMKKHLLGGLAAVLVVGFAASAAHAQCSFGHPKKAKKFQGSFVQAFVS